SEKIRGGAQRSPPRAMEHLQKAGLAGASCVPRFVVVAAMLFKRDVRVNSLNNHNRHTHKSNNHRLQRPNSLNSLAEAEEWLRAANDQHAVLRVDAKVAKGCALRGVVGVCPGGVQGALLVIKSSNKHCPFWIVPITICSVV